MRIPVMKKHCVIYKEVFSDSVNVLNWTSCGWTQNQDIMVFNSPKWHPEVSPLPSPLVTPLSALPTHVGVIVQTCCLSRTLWAIQPTAWHIYSRMCTCKHAESHAVQWWGCLWLHQMERLSCVTQVNGDEARFVCLCVCFMRVWGRIGGACVAAWEKIKAPKEGGQLWFMMKVKDEAKMNCLGIQM